MGLNPSSSIPASISLWAADFTSLFPISVSVGWGGDNVGYLSILVEIKMLTIQVTTAWHVVSARDNQIYYHHHHLTHCVSFLWLL